MIIRCINHFTPAFVSPDFFVNSLTVGAVAIATGVMVRSDMSAIVTTAEVYPQFSGFAIADGMGSTALNI